MLNKVPLHIFLNVTQVKNIITIKQKILNRGFLNSVVKVIKTEIEIAFFVKPN